MINLSHEMFWNRQKNKHEKKIYLLSFNQERRGVNSMQFPEIKYETTFTLRYSLNKSNMILLSYENEIVNNYNYSNNNTSKSNLLWIGYRFTFGR